MLQALIFDSYFDKHRGVIAYVRVFRGELKVHSQIHFLATKGVSEAMEVGYFRPHLESSGELLEGEVGYIITGLKDLEMVKVGDTITDKQDMELALPGYKEVKPTVFASLFPVDADDYPKLKDSMAKLKLNDASLIYETENIPAIGYGFRCGFLGLLHMDIVQERLSREYDLDLVLTTPSVEYLVQTTSGEELKVANPSALPEPSKIDYISEPWVKLDILCPEEYIGKVIELITARRGQYTSMSMLTEGQLEMEARLPLAEMVIDFYDELKSLTKGYATLSYDFIGFEKGDLVKLDIMVNYNVVTPLAVMTHRDNAYDLGKRMVEKLKTLIPRQQFDIAIQAAIGSKVIARETIKAFRKDVTAKLYGGDMTRRKKLLEKQKKGKKRMKMVGNVEIPQSAFLNVLKK